MGQGHGVKGGLISEVILDLVSLSTKKYQITTLSRKFEYRMRATITHSWFETALEY